LRALADRLRCAAGKDAESDGRSDTESSMIENEEEAQMQQVSAMKALPHSSEA
jgi:hypothetical protein